jgi:DNA processing protein
MANDYNRDLFAVPGRTSDKYSQGCNNLIKTQRANLMTSAADLVYILNWQINSQDQTRGKAELGGPNNNKVIQKQLFVSLDNDEQKVYDYLQRNGKQLLDSIALECEFPIFRISSLLLNMELKGVIRPLPGKLFEAI